MHMLDKEHAEALAFAIDMDLPMQARPSIGHVRSWRSWSIRLSTCLSLRARIGRTPWTW